MKSLFSKQDTVNSTPHYRPRSFLDSVEGNVYKALSEVFDANTKVFAKVCLAELVAAPKTDRQYLAHWRRVQRRTIDFLICSASTLKPILAIKLETELDSKKRRASGPGVLEEVLEDISLPLLRLRAQDEYDAEDLVKKINFTLKENSQPRPVTSNQPKESEAITTTINRKLTVAAKSATNLWTNTKDKYRVRTSQISRETSK
ncbi:MAG: DUF2726 domain-containing protein [Arenicellales bacterium]|nr:DUF2726 domain-containing protein [Arenicellales bacterium]